MTRRDAREQAFVLIFEKSFNKDDSIDDIIKNATEGRNIEVDPFAFQLASGWMSHVDEIDEQIEKHSTKWKMNRISRVALSILRLSIYELLFSKEVPDRVAINEAVELAKKFGTDEDSSFVNGVLGAVMRSKPANKTEND
ncbi:NusB antitermination factor [Hydrogenoanaerobacterium saccharovorans]|uniref:Transcription antitermination protein NusB n=1 Tax=Hydrogenoanaerobacterium saccharovorans TaxID=474960 RepID=A0A1H7ZNK0_9FIRM|nr:transcription antitermination factor NusB [Hydrogenoanaerobacterium saccharovorans]RPF48488.1 NusB antitermination factor [Hydrogenoanaerobacterium saccharovorans]SEM59925.1 NusB antitermination factor [Hydrogenoanaerobacterium saccharovorans]